MSISLPPQALSEAFERINAKYTWEFRDGVLFAVGGKEVLPRLTNETQEEYLRNLNWQIEAEIERAVQDYDERN